MALTQVPPALLTSTTGTGSTVVLSASPTFTGTITTPGVTFSDASSQTAAASPYVLKNRIINGDMRINQRNATVTITNADTYSVDRFFGTGQASDGVFTLQQSTTAPTGFNNSLLATVTTADSSIGSSQYYLFIHRIEGYNIADLGWGTANAKTVTLSFWVRSSVTGTFGGSLRNSAADRSYPYSYTISAANTWEQKTITIAGDTTGTWLTDNGIGISIAWSLGDGSSRLNTAGAWAAGSYSGATGQTNLIATNGATWYITGVQLEQNTSATPFERRLYNQELANCQRYCIVYQNNAASVGDNFRFFGGIYNTTTGLCAICFPVPLRVAPTGVTVSGTFNFFTNNASAAYSTIGFDVASTKTADVAITGTSYTTNAIAILSSSTNAKIEFTGTEL